MKNSTKTIITNFIIMTGNDLIAQKAGNFIGNGIKNRENKKITAGLAMAGYAIISNYQAAKNLGEAIAERYLEREEVKEE